MTDEGQKKRAWFQIHLSTAIVLMFVAGVLVWATIAYLHYADNMLWYENTFLELIVSTGVFCIFDLSILVAVGVACEWAIRRRERARD